MNADKPDFKPTLRDVASAVSTLLQTTREGMNALERQIQITFDKQVINRLLGQYDGMVKAGLRPQEALKAVTDLVKNRLENAISEREKK